MWFCVRKFKIRHFCSFSIMFFKKSSLNCGAFMRNGPSRWLFDSSGLGCGQRELRFGAVLIFSDHLDSKIINQIIRDTNGISPCPEITEDRSMTTFSVSIITCVVSLLLLFLARWMKLELYMRSICYVFSC